MTRKRRSFPIPISTNYADRAVAEQVLIDLVHKHPRGPNGTLTKADYRGYGTDPTLYEQKAGETCGYKNVDLYRMVLALTDVTDSNPTAEWDYRQLVYNMFPDAGERGWTRRSRRFANRLGRAVSRVMRDGLPGIWNASWGYGDANRVMIHANSEEDAKIQAKMFFGAIIGDNEYRLSSQFIREGSALELLHANEPLVKHFNREVERTEKRIQEMREQIEQYEISKQFVEMYAINCMSAAQDESEVL